MYSIYRSNRNIVFSCKYHVVWCPKYRRFVSTVGGTPLAIVKQYIENQKNV